MFSNCVDDDIQLVLLHPGLASHYARLAAEDYDYLSQWLAWPAVCKTEADFLCFIRQSLHKYADGSAMDCGICYRGDIVGNVGFNTINPSLQRVEIGYWLAQSHQGKGIMTRACRYLIHYAFTELQMEKVQISAAEQNHPSRAVCERLGMQLEGIITRQEKVGNRVLDHAVYGLQRSQEGPGW